MASEAGKGSKQRPTNKEAFDEAYDRIWNKKKKEPRDTYYESDSEIISDIKYDINIPSDHYAE
jgi:hypothetical protein